MRSSDTNKFLITSARHQSGNASGLAAQFIWHPAGGADFAEKQARAALEGPR
ncbi:hypothetical protein ACQ86G_30450 [Roseateles chitinivorans]|uniref:hypothetical protein n=1 Tax=Roseateles chitinivorans TaxID=2917965 RepID=UPI003D6665F1